MIGNAMISDALTVVRALAAEPSAAEALRSGMDPLFLVLTIVGLGMVALGLALLARRLADPQRRAAEALRRRLDLTREHNDTLFSLCSAPGSPPHAAVMISERAFAEAARRAWPRTNDPEAAAIESLRKKIFQ